MLCSSLLYALIIKGVFLIININVFLAPCCDQFHIFLSLPVFSHDSSIIKTVCKAIQILRIGVLLNVTQSVFSILMYNFCIFLY